MSTDTEGIRLINGGRKAELEEIKMFVDKISQTKLTDEKKLEAIKNHLDRRLSDDY